MEIKGKIIIVTGAASGIGRGLCQRFAKEGAQAVIAADVNEAGAKETAAEIKGDALLCDVSKEDDVIRLAKFARDKYGRVDLVCSNAGILGAPGGYEVANDIWQRIWEINVLAHVFVARAVIPDMIRQGGGAIMITASALGFKPDRFFTLFGNEACRCGAGREPLYHLRDQGIQIFCCAAGSRVGDDPRLCGRRSSRRGWTDESGATGGCGDGVICRR